jgi:hypothetical protein
VRIDSRDLDLAELFVGERSRRDDRRQKRDDVKDDNRLPETDG